jgi:asparagine synthase (glutamine-hydrolysing)
MSGICGICEPGAPAQSLRIEAMIAQLDLGGETRASIASDGFSAAVSQRWRDQQVGEFGGVRVAVDADLWNFRAVGDAAVKAGDAPPSSSAAELIAALYLKHGLEFVHKLNGAFAIALWDERNQRLVLTLDRLGIKGLAWRQEGDRLLFSTRVGAVRAASRENLDADPAAMVQYFVFSVVPAPLSAFRGIQKLEPGTQLIFEKTNIQQRRYWDVRYEEKCDSEARWTERVREGIRGGVLRTVAECDPETTGAFLSGGTDSSSVVAFMTEWHKPTKSYSIIFDDAKYSEASFAHATANHLSADHHELRLYPGDALTAIEKISGLFDEPFGNSSAIGGYYCAKFARDPGVTTLLAGDGGDEIFAGNERYAKDRMFQFYHRIPSPLRAVLRGGTKLLPNSGPFSLPGRYIKRASIPNPRRMMSYMLALSTPANEIFEPEVLRAAPPETWLSIPERHFEHAPAATSQLNRLMYLDVKMTLADNDLRKVVGTAELADVQVRFPFLDHELVQLAAEIPTPLKMKGNEKRYIFKQAMSGILPDMVLYKKKHGFGVPMSLWLLHDKKLNSMLNDVLSDSQTLQRGWLRPSFVKQLLHDHQHGHAGYYGENVWYLMMLELWQRRHLAPEKAVARVE